ncbi:type II toxin-antitoxin system VapB family antitoxin [Methylobacterium organophilum]|uniref:Ribbon-helix-helix protein CopG domain-containing protein n=1 Tax=Methylobacterium organophilum TaxID=410 RepID=A0ABQ4TDE6_METOR|nr:type II toxin-antitoxin system VapB family antitoxin [Methylobacterium organophilum]UMY16295.1 type II toxin-antitoxin system VapB family antitoxin [Methylobacterium organophilum]GJE29613.1 hypothetical protein LKMONMHP_4495 [Methylobacterium organophilum]
MTIRIENPEAEALLVDLERATGRDRADLIVELLRRERDRLAPGRERMPVDAKESARLLRESVQARVLIDSRPLDEVLAYDENGLPV